MTMFREGRPTDARIARFSVECEDLVERSPEYAMWRSRLLRDGSPSRVGLSLDLGNKITAHLAAESETEQPITFGIAKMPATRLKLRHARPDDTETPLRLETSEHYWLEAWRSDPYQQIVRMVEAVTPIRIAVDGSRRVVTSVNAPDQPPLELRAVGTRLCGTFTPDGEALDVLRLAEAESLYVGGTVVPIASLPGTPEETAAILRRLSFLSAPAARRLVRLHAQGEATEEVVHHLVRGSLPSSPTRRHCVLCQEWFTPSVYALAVGPARARICPSCHEAFDRELADAGPSERPLDVLISIAELIERVPSQGWLGDVFATDDPDLYLNALRLQASLGHGWRSQYGTWFGALVASGLISDGAQRMVVGTRVLANDGHMCTSLGEKTIDDWLHGLGVEHSREPVYPGSQKRADFRIGDMFIEYFGLAGVPAYDRKSELKRNLARDAGILLVEITPSDLSNWSTTQHRVARELGLTLK
ncbi:hypothetical protein [Cellulomonas sp. HZM]|uniref:hypothetical protein n=1 Tax=Cellulomonas sp. HZM TaxID=1454010 RepID=UPI000492FA00|nr:hypothetical protein [Cellulomonas sp. HZM]